MCLQSRQTVEEDPTHLTTKETNNKADTSFFNKLAKWSPATGPWVCFSGRYLGSASSPLPVTKGRGQHSGGSVWTLTHGIVPFYAYRQIVTDRSTLTELPSLRKERPEASQAIIFSTPRAQQLDKQETHENISSFASHESPAGRGKGLAGLSHLGVAHYNISKQLGIGQSSWQELGKCTHTRRMPSARGHPSYPGI